MSKRASSIATKPGKPTFRLTRRHSLDPDDQRTPAQKDRDRLLYSGSLRRLAGVTQVASANEVDMLHNRLTHTLKVAQVGRRIAELLIAKRPSLRSHINADVVEAAALAHDLGHPPFGHIAEEQLDECLQKAGAGDGYEGNAQSFRIVTQLAYSKSKFVGLNLTRATLAATIKYPWFREADGHHNPKFGAYQSERDDFEFARERHASSTEKTIEAQIMDLADDITYSIHDMEDFYQLGMIPLDRLAKDPGERAVFFENTKRRWGRRPELKQFGEYEKAFNDVADLMPLRGPSTGNAAQRRALKPFVSKMIKDYVMPIDVKEVDSPVKFKLDISKRHLREIAMLKELTWHYVIQSASLATLQFGQRKIIRDLFEIYADAVSDKKKRNIIPPWFALPDQLPTKDSEIARLAADIVSTLTDRQAHVQYMRLKGITPGSIRDWT